MKTKAAVKNQSRKYHTWGQNHAAGKLPPGNNPVLATPDPSIINPAAQFGFFGPLESPNQPTRRGRPTLNDNELRGRRDELAYVFESYWAEIGWQLGCARKPEDIQKAFEPLRGKYGEDRVKFLLRPTSQPATSSLIRTTGKALSKALEEERSAQTAYDSQVEKCQEAKAAVYEGSPEHRLSLKKEVTFRLKNIRQLEKERTLKEKILRKAESELHKAEVASQQSTGADFAKRQVEYQDTKAAYETAKATCETEKKILRATKERLAAASPERWALAKEEAQRRQAELEKLEALLATARSKVQNLERVLADQETGFARAELVRFIASKRGAHTPRNLANAVAGLPRISCRVSFTRCRAFPFEIEPGLHYQVFEFIAGCWRRRKSSFAQPPVSLFRSEIERLAKTKLINGKKIQNFFRRHLEENWWALEAAIKECWNSKPHPRAVPYIVAANFQNNLGKPKTYLDRVLIERETANI